EMDYRGRRRRVQQQLREYHLGALLVTHLPNLRYLCGFTGSAGVLLATDSRVAFFTDGRYREQARSEVQGARVTVPKGPVLDAALRAIAKLKIKTVGVESDHMSLAAGRKVSRCLGPGKRVRQT